SIKMAIAKPQCLLDNAGAGAPAQFPCAQTDRGDFGAIGFDKVHGCALWLRVALCRAGSVLPTATPITRPARPGQLLASAAKTVSGACAITASSARAGPRGARLPCSQFRMVSTGTPRRAANSCWVSRARRRRSRTSRVPPSADMPKASGASGNSRPSRNSTIRPSAFSRKRCIVATLTRDAQSSAKPVKARLTINPLTGLTLFQPEPEGCDSEEGEEADHVSDRRDKGSRGDRRIGPQLFQHNRNQDAAERPSHEVADDREPDHDSEPRNLEPDHSRDAGDDGKADAVDKADQDFADGHAERIARTELACRERAHRDSHSLGGSVAALARDDRRQHRKRHHLLELSLEQAEHGGSKECGRQVDQQPVEAGLGDGPDIVRQLFIAGDAAERLDLLVRLFLDDIDHVVDGDDANKAILGIDH